MPIVIITLIIVVHAKLCIIVHALAKIVYDFSYSYKMVKLKTGCTIITEIVFSITCPAHTQCVTITGFLIILIT